MSTSDEPVEIHDGVCFLCNPHQNFEGPFSEHFETHHPDVGKEQGNAGAP